MSGIRETRAPAWMPIATAPSGVSCLVCDGYEMRVAFQAPRSSSTNRTEWFYFDNEYEDGEGNLIWEKGTIEPSHWMPLPEPPVSE